MAPKSQVHPGSKILNIDLTEALLSSNKQWFTNSSVEAMKSTGADIITLQSSLKPNSTQDLLYLFGPEYEHVLTHGNDLSKKSPKTSTAILWRKDRYRAKLVNVKSLAGAAVTTFLTAESSMTMVHLWAIDRADLASLTVISWTPDPARRSGMPDRTRLAMLESLLRFLALFRRGSNVKMRFMICGHYGVDVTKANFGPFPFFKYFSLVKPNHLKSDIFVSPFIFSEDSLKANEKGVPNVFPLMSNRNIKMLQVVGLFRDYVSEKAEMTPGNLALTESYLKSQDRRMKSTRSSESGLSKMSRREKAARTIQRAMAMNVQRRKRERGEISGKDNRKGNLMDRVVQAFHFAALRKHVREEKAFLKAVERNTFREMEAQEKLQEEQRKQAEIFPPLKKSKKLLKPIPSTSTLNFSPYEENYPRSSLGSSASSEGRPNKNKNDPDLFGLPPINPKLEEKKMFMNTYTAKYLTPKHIPKPDQVAEQPKPMKIVQQPKPIQQVSDVTFSLPSSTTSSADYRRKVSDLSPRHKFKNKHSPY